MKEKNRIQCAEGAIVITDPKESETLEMRDQLAFRIGGKFSALM
jgi:hypothetical protein